MWDSWSPDALPADNCSFRNTLETRMTVIQEKLRTTVFKAITPIIYSFMQYAVIDSVLSALFQSSSAPATFNPTNGDAPIPIAG
jgi:hypothetical protein